MQNPQRRWCLAQHGLLTMLLVFALSSCSDSGVGIADTASTTGTSGTTDTSGTTGTTDTIGTTGSTNTPPVIGDIAIDPAALFITSTITAKHNPVTDADNDNFTSYYLWRINDNQPVLSDTPNLANTPIKRGDRISVELVVSDGVNEVRALSSDAIVSNSTPHANSINLGPSGAKTGDELSVSITDTFDADGDEVTSTFRWFLNGGLMNNQSNNVLSAGIATGTDIVTVEVTLSDGIDSTVIMSNELLLQDTPSYLVVDPATPTMTYGTTSSFTVKFDDDDGPVKTELIQAPDGFAYDADTATATWTPTPYMTSNEENFYAQFSSSDGQSESVKITVLNDLNDLSSLMVARSGIPIPAADFELDIGDFDGDGRNEVLSTDSRELIFTLEFDGTSIKQDWLYPFSVAPGESILRVWAHGADLSQILVVTTRGVSLIDSRTELPTRVLDTTYDIAASAFGDIDNDGVKEMLIINPQGEMNLLNTDDWSLATFGETLTEAEWPNYTYTVELGNVDDDPALEIVISNGQVVDGDTGDIQWTHFAPFGSLITIGDVDGDGDTDIVAANRWDNVTSYDPIAQTSLWAYNINDFCSLRLHNIDGDLQDELIAGPCQHGSVEIYDGSSNTMVLQDDIDDPDYNSTLRSYSLGDLDNDGIDELIFSTGSGSTAEDNMAVVSFASLGDSTPGVVVNTNPSQIYGFNIIGWDTTTTAKERAVFVLPDTEGGVDGQRLGLLSTNGEFIVSDVTAPNWDGVAAGIVVDSNNDGINEVVVGVGNVRDGEIHHIALDTLSQLNLHTEIGQTDTWPDPEIVSVALGIDTDGSAKAIIANDKLAFQIYDIASQQADWTSGGLTGGNMIETITVNKPSGFDIVAATQNELTLWKKSENAYAKHNTAAAECSEIKHMKLDGVERIACLTTDIWGEESTISLFNLDLVKQTDLIFDYGITAMASTPDGEILIGVTNEIGSYYGSHENTLRTIDSSNGAILWTSAPLLGRINAMEYLEASANGKTKMAVSTSSAMYIME